MQEEGTGFKIKSKREQEAQAKFLICSRRGFLNMVDYSFPGGERRVQDQSQEGARSTSNIFDLLMSWAIKHGGLLVCRRRAQGSRQKPRGSKKHEQRLRCVAAELERNERNTSLTVITRPARSGHVAVFSTSFLLP